VLGCLVEKQLTTPQQYPLTLNALALACSQVSNREPTMTMGEDAVQRALDELKVLRLVRFVLPSHGRSVTRYRHVLDEAYGLDSARAALLAVLLLRGPQTPGELRARTGRMAEFDSVRAVQDELAVLADQPEPLVRELPRRPGQKEERWQQLAAAESDETSVAVAGGRVPATVDGPDIASQDAPSTGTVAHNGPDGFTGPDDLENQVKALRYEVEELRRQVAELSTSLNSLRRSLGD
jgi:uncharacterized protein YceH (UPF0502 family)